MNLPLYPDVNACGHCLIPVWTVPDKNGTLIETTDIPEDLDMPDISLKWRILHKELQLSPGWSAIYDTAQDALRAYQNQYERQPASLAERPEICTMLTLSTAHLTPETVAKLTANPETDELCLTVYPKNQFGWYVYFSGLPQSMLNNLPDDLMLAVQTARNLNCDALCFDCDAEPLSYLPVYESDDETLN